MTHEPIFPCYVFFKFGNFKISADVEGKESQMSDGGMGPKCQMGVGSVSWQISLGMAGASQFFNFAYTNGED